MAIISKRKGNAFERKVAKLLSEWWSEGSRDDLFWRTHSSGGRHTVRRRKGITTEGQVADVVSSAEESKLFSDIIDVECKHHKDINLWSILTPNKGENIVNWWLEIRKVSIHDGKLPVLIAKQDRRPDLWVCNECLSGKISEYVNVNPIFTLDVRNYNSKLSCVSLDMCIYKFDDILAIPAEIFKQILTDFLPVIEEISRPEDYDEKKVDEENENPDYLIDKKPETIEVKKTVGNYIKGNCPIWNNSLVRKNG